MLCLRVRVVLCDDGIDLNALKCITLGRVVFGGAVKLIMKSKNSD